MTSRPYVSFAEVKQKVPMPDALAALGMAERFRRNGDTLTGVCPLPSHNHGPQPNVDQFKINRKDGLWLWHCFGDCHKGGDVVEFVKEVMGYSNAHVRYWFAEHFGDRLGLSKPNGKEKVEKDTAREVSQGEPTQAAPQSPSNLPTEPMPIKPLRFRLSLDPDVPYLRDRGLTPETIERYALGLCRRGILKGYVAIPVYRHPREDENENPVAYLGRWPGENYDESAGRPRYKWPDGFAKMHVVYGLKEALATSAELPLIVVEGPFSVYHLVQSGFPNTVAIFGSSLSVYQAELLLSTQRPLLLLFDGDESGQIGMSNAAALLMNQAFARVVRLAATERLEDFSSDKLSQVLW